MTSISPGQITVYCVNKDACNSMNILINHTNSISSVFCNNLGACNDFYYFSVSRASQNTLSLYAYSENVIAANIQSIECIETTKYITYFRNTTLKSLQNTIGNLPCDGVTKVCGNTSCDTTYEIRVLDTKYIDQMSDNQCYYIPISNVTERSCDECENKGFAKLVSSDTLESNTLFFWFIFFVLFISLVISIAAYAYNLYPRSHADNGRFYIPLIVGLQICNFYTDINLCVEILDKSSLNHDIFVLIAGIGVLIFIILPFLINFTFAAKRNLKSIIRSNIACKYYFDSKTNYILFFVFMISTGATWIGLALLSSRIFAVSVLNNGLTVYD